MGSDTAAFSNMFSNNLVLGSTRTSDNGKETSNPSASVRQTPNTRGNRAELLALVLGSGFLLSAFFIPPLQHEHGKSFGLAIQIGILLWYAIVFFIGETVRRLCLLYEEVHHLTTRYDGSLSRVLFQVFNTRFSANLTKLVVLLSLIFVSYIEPMVVVEIGSHWTKALGLVGLYLILLSVIKITENLIDCDLLLDTKVMAIGQGLAYSYYYGFLKIVLPATENNKSIRERVTHFELEEKVRLASKKLLILIPDTCFCTPSFQDMSPSGQIERIKSIEDVVVSRAGMKARPYSTNVYLIQPEGKKIPVYVMMEMPSILYVLYEMNTVGQINSKLSSFERTQQAQAFYLVLRRLLEEDPSCKDMYEIVYYKDQDVNLADLVYNHVQNLKE